MSKAAIHQSENLYSFLLTFYPGSFRREYGEEMKYVFSESLKEAYTANGGQGLMALWRRTIIDAAISITSQHLDNLKGSETMKSDIADVVLQNKVFLWIAVATGLILLIPLIAMQFTGEVNWTSFDFIVMGVLLFGTGSLFVVTARRVERKHWTLVGLVVAAAFLYLWAELAVGIFTNWGS